jgi:hypothetical protein
MDDLLLPAHLITVALLAVVYFIPIFIARNRKAKAISGIAITNIFLGWTFVGWVVALAWAASGEVVSASNPSPQEPPLAEHKLCVRVNERGSTRKMDISSRAYQCGYLVRKLLCLERRTTPTH